jgi:hypothetical protein
MKNALRARLRAGAQPEELVTVPGVTFSPIALLRPTAWPA